MVHARGVRGDKRGPWTQIAMSQQDLFERILASLHEAALDDARWPATSGLIDEACGAKGNSLVTGVEAARDETRIFFAPICYRGQRHAEFERVYYESYYHLDERVPRVRQLADSHIVHVSSLFTDEEMKTSLVYNEALPLAHSRDSLYVRLDGPDGSRIVWVIADPTDSDGWSSSQVEMIQRLLPHIRQFVRVRQALVDSRALGASLADLLENTRRGVIQLDLHGRIVDANDRARDLLRKGDGLSDQRGFLHASSSLDNAALQELLASVLPPFDGQGASGSIMVTRPNSAPRLAVHVSPVGEEQKDLRTSRVAALVLVVDLADRARIHPDVVAAALGLTPAESRVALDLAQGSSIREIAVATGRRPDTIRWHMKHIFGKLDLSRQVDLVQLVQSLADLPSVRR